MSKDMRNAAKEIASLLGGKREGLLEYAAGFLDLVITMLTDSSVGASKVIVFNILAAIYRAGENNDLHSTDHLIHDLIRKEQAALQNGERSMRKAIFPILSLDREDLDEAGFDQNRSDEEMREIAEGMRRYIDDDSEQLVMPCTRQWIRLTSHRFRWRQNGHHIPC